jgi:hypothetical protein
MTRVFGPGKSAKDALSEADGLIGNDARALSTRTCNPALTASLATSCRTGAGTRGRRTGFGFAVKPCRNGTL